MAYYSKIGIDTVSTNKSYLLLQKIYFLLSQLSLTLILALQALLSLKSLMPLTNLNALLGIGFHFLKN